MTATAIFGDQRNEQGEGVGCRGGRGATQKRDKKRDRNFLPGWLWLVFFWGAALVFRVLLGPLRPSGLCLCDARRRQQISINYSYICQSQRRVASHRIASGSSSGRSARLMATPSALAAAHTALFLHPLFSPTPARRLHNSICVKVL